MPGFNPGQLTSAVYSSGGGVAPTGGTVNVFNVADFLPVNGSAVSDRWNDMQVHYPIPAGSKATMYVPPGAVVGLDKPTSIFPTTRLWMAKGAKFIATAAGVTLTIDGDIDFPVDQIFDNSVFAFAVALGDRVPFALPEWWGARFGSPDDTGALRSAILAAPRGGVRCSGKVYVFLDDISAAMNSRGLVQIEAANPHTFEGRGANPVPVSTKFDISALNKYFWTKDTEVNDVTNWRGIYFDGGGLATCPGAINGNDQYQYNLTIDRCQFRNFGYPHTNVAGQRAILDIQCVDVLIKECFFDRIGNGRALRAAGTLLRVERSAFFRCREAYDLQVDSGFLDQCRFENCTVIGSQLGGSLTRRKCWYEQIGFNVGTAHVSGISQRNRGFVFGAGALVAAGGIITPFHQLYGSCQDLYPKFNGLATGGTAFTAAAWYEAVGQASNSALYGGNFDLIEGDKPIGEALFSATMAMNSTERGPFFTVRGEDSHGTDSGSAGASLFTGVNGAADARKCNIGFGRINSADFSFIQLARFSGGRFVFDIMDNPWATVGAPGATQYPHGDQWRIGDKFIEPVPVAGGVIGRVCTTAGTGAPVWKTFGAIAP